MKRSALHKSHTIVKHQNVGELLEQKSEGLLVVPIVEFSLLEKLNLLQGNIYMVVREITKVLKITEKSYQTLV